MCRIILLSIVVSISFLSERIHSLPHTSDNNSSQAYAHAFCHYMKSTPEPRVLIYNRIPKCGSQSMTNILLQIQHHDSSIDQTSRWKQFWWPGDMDTNTTLVSQFASALKKRLVQNKRVRITGHWYWHTFDAVHDFGLKRSNDVEYINILRECAPRFKSQLLFDLFDTKEAKAAKMNNKLTAHTNSLLYKDITVRECIEDFACLNNVFRKRILEENHQKLTGMMVEFLSGTKAKQEEGNSSFMGALKHLNKLHHEDEGYSALGFLEYYEESLELLECAYPTFFRHALQIYQQQQTHLHRSSVSHDPVLYKHPHFEQVLQPLCDVADNPLYQIALDQFWSKLDFVRKDRKSCCRSPRLRRPL